MHPLYPPDLHSEALDPTTWYNLVGAAGCVCWIVAYVLIIRKSHRDRAYGLPAIAICLNFAWELLASFVIPNPVALWHAFDRAWLLIDVVIVYQLLRYGPGLQRIPELKRWFPGLVALGIVFGGLGQLAFVVDYRDRLGLVVAFMINIVMSYAFIRMYFDRRPGLRGISLGAGVFKMLGTLGTSIECHFVVAAIDELPSFWFLTFCSVTIFLLDLAYVGLLYRERRSSAAGPSSAPSAA